MKKAIYIFSDGELKRKQNTLFFENNEGKKKYVPIENTGEIFIFGEVTINKKLLEILSKAEILLHFFNYHGYYVGSYYPREHYNSGFMILKQSEFYMDSKKRLDLATRFIRGAITNMKKVITYYINRDVFLEDHMKNIEELEDTIDCRKTISELMAVEGNVRGFYYNAFSEIVKSEDFQFCKRTKRPPENRLNALISFGNSVLHSRSF